MYRDRFGNYRDDFGNIVNPQSSRGFNGYNRVPRMSKRDILNIFQQQMNAPEMELVEDCQDDYARHICNNGKIIQLLPKSVCPFQTPQGIINITYYRCNICGKLLVDKNFM